MDYLVRWEIDVDDAASPEDAARQALGHQRAPGSIADVFEVRPKDEPQRRFVVDLTRGTCVEDRDDVRYVIYDFDSEEVIGGTYNSCNDAELDATELPDVCILPLVVPSVPNNHN